MIVQGIFLSLGMIKRFHEAPKSIFKQVQQLTDGDYALVHLFEKDPEYLELFKKAVKEGREVILDNSVFELEKAFDPERFVYWINELNPTYYIVPDVLEDADGTISNMAEWMGIWKEKVTTDSKIIGVVQGEDYESIKRCYLYMDAAGVDKIAISFDYSYYRKSFPHPNRIISWSLGRVKLLEDLIDKGILNREKPHHLLGCGTPGEGIFYNSSDYSFIDSVDTSSPVVHGLKHILYDGPLGLTKKESQKLCDLIDSDVNYIQWINIKHNIKEFQRLWNGFYGVSEK